MPPYINTYRGKITIALLASIYALRILGLFLILPVFSIYAHHLPGATPRLIGLAFGIYGLTQAVFQIPFDYFSNRLSRKSIIILGLLIFALGSSICAIAHSITILIIGRALQGSGAIGTVLSALVADLTAEENRTKAMTTINIVTTLSFSAAIALGPLLNAIINVRGIFWLGALLALVGIAILVLITPNPNRQIFHYDAEPRLSQLIELLQITDLIRLNVGGFLLHAILTAIFIASPLILAYHGLPEKDQGWLYVPVILLALLLMLPFLILARRKRYMKPMLVGAIIILTLTQIFLYALHIYVFIDGILLLFFFTAFTILETCLPSWISKIAPAGSKGSAMCIYSSAQFLGIFAGGLLAGAFYSKGHLGDIFLLCSLLGVIWLLISRNMHAPRHVSSYMINVGKLSKSETRQLQNQLAQIPGVTEVVIIDGVAYLKIDTEIINPKDLRTFSSSQYSFR